MKRDARIGLAIVLMLGLLTTFLVARAIHQPEKRQAQAEELPGLALQSPAQRLAPDLPPGLVEERGASLEQNQERLNEFLEGRQRPPVPQQPSLSPEPGLPQRQLAEVVALDNGPDLAHTATVPQPNRPAQSQANRRELPPLIPEALPPVTRPETALHQGAGPNLAAVRAPMVPERGPAPVSPPAVVAVPERPAVPKVEQSGWQYTIQEGDNPWRVAEKVFGEGKWAYQILKANSGLTPEKMKVGATLLIPSLPNLSPKISLPQIGSPSLERTAQPSASPAVVPVAPAVPARERALPAEMAREAVPNKPPQIAGEDGIFSYEIKPGDTVAAIAKQYYGQSGPKSIKRILDANPGLEPNAMQVGERVKVPAKEQ